ADIRLCADHVKLGLTETSLAIIPGAGGTQRLARLIGIGQAKKLIFTAEVISAEDALHLGVVENVTAKETLMPEAIKMAKQIAQNGPIAIKQAKAAIDHGIETNLHTALDIENMYYQQAIPTKDRREGLNAFQQKRKPIYKGEEGAKLMSDISGLNERIKDIKKGGKEKYHQANSDNGKMFVLDRLKKLFDHDIEIEDAFFANCTDGDLPADGVVTGMGKINGQNVCVMANDSTVKAGSWGKRTVEKIIRIQETAIKLEVPMLYLVDSAGARITDQVHMFPGRRGAGRIFHNQIKMSGHIPQICLLFGPSAAGGAYIPAFCDVVVMVDGNASMYLGSPRMAEMVIGEKVSLEEMGGANMHCSVSGCGDVLVENEQEAVDFARKYLTYFPANFRSEPESKEPKSPATFEKDIEELLPKNQNAPFNMHDLILRTVDEDSFLEIKKSFAKEVITGLARIEGETVGIIANQPRVKGGVLFPDSADKAAKFIQLC